MIVFDADSMMTGHSLIQMLQVMEQNQTIGILQTAAWVNRESAIARVQQFANHVYGPILERSEFIQLGDSFFWDTMPLFGLLFHETLRSPRLSGNLLSEEIFSVMIL